MNIYKIKILFRKERLTIKTKVCTKCKRELSIEMFSKNKRSKDGYQSQCKDCQKQYYEDNKENIQDYQKKYREENNEIRKEKGRRYYQEHKEQFNEQYERTKNNVRRVRSKWRKNNKDKTKEYSRKYQQKINDLPHTLTEEEWENTLKEFDYKCAYCGEDTKLEKDHFVAVSNNGEYTVKNILPTCRKCNTKKRDKDFFEWYPYYEFYSKEREIQILNYLEYIELN